MTIYYILKCKVLCYEFHFYCLILILTIVWHINIISFYRWITEAQKALVSVSISKAIRTESGGPFKPAPPRRLFLLCLWRKSRHGVERNLSIINRGGLINTWIFLVSVNKNSGLNHSDEVTKVWNIKIQSMEKEIRFI